MHTLASGTSSAMSSCDVARSTANYPGSGSGLALLERRGVAAWARAWQGTTPASQPQRPTGSVLELPAASSELVGALASMALACVAAG